MGGREALVLENVNAERGGTDAFGSLLWHMLFGGLIKGACPGGLDSVSANSGPASGATDI